MVKDFEDGSNAVMHLYEDHLMKQLQKLGVDNRNCLKNLKSLLSSGTNQGLQVNKSLTEKCVLAVLDKTTLAEYQHGEELDKSKDLMKKVLKYSQFWYWISTAQGTLADSLWAHCAYTNAKKLSRDFGKAVTELGVSPEYFKQAQQVTRRDGHFVYHMMSALHTGTDANYWENIFKTASHAFKEMETKGKQMKTLFDFYLANLNHYAPMYDLLEFQEELFKRTNLQDTGKLFSQQGFSSMRFWGNLHEFSDTACTLFDLQIFKSFLPFCIRQVNEGKLKELYSEDVVTATPTETSGEPLELGSTAVSLAALFEETKDEEEEIADAKPDDDVKKGCTCMQVAKFLNEFCQPEYVENLKEMLIQDTDIPVIHILQMFPDIKEIEEERQKAAEFLKIQSKANKKKSLQNLAMFPNLKDKVANLEGVLEAFGIKQEESDQLSAAMKDFKNYTEERSGHTMLYAVSDVVVKLQEIFKEMNEGHYTWDVVHALSKAKTLISFLREVADEDMRNLIDASEEHSEQHVQVSTVSDLIQVHRALHPIFAGKETHECLNSFFLRLCRIAHPDPNNAHAAKNLAGKITGCAQLVHSLKALYQNVANRGEQTKAIVSNALSKGSFKFEIQTTAKECLFHLQYKHNKEESIFKMQDLFDLRSRALLIANAEKDDSKKESDDEIVQKQKKVDMQKFVEIIDKATSIAETCTQLHQSGNFNYRKYKKATQHGKFEELDQVFASLENELSNWQSALENAREKFYYLNFLWGDQLAILKNFFERKHISKEVRSIFHFIHPEIVIDTKLFNVYQHSSKSREDLQTQLEDLGEALHRIVSPLKPYTRTVEGLPSLQNVDMKIRPGELYIAHLDPGSSQLIPVVTMLYADTVQKLPESSQILFCNEDTVWEEIRIVLNRCLHSKRKTGLQELFCIANIELLPNEMQFQLTEELQKALRNAEESYVKDFLLCLVCKSSPHDPIIDQFYKYVHRVNGLSQAAMEDLLHRYWPDVYMLTSEVPGLGKSETVLERAAERGMGTTTLTLSGPLTRDMIVGLIEEMHVRGHEVLHIDINTTPNPSFLDSFLFELIVVGMVSSGTNFACVPTKHIAVEIANSIQHNLRDSLTFLQCFQRVHLHWNNYRDFKVSKEPNSSTQVVCKHLHSLYTGQLDSEDIHLNSLKGKEPLSAESCQKLLKEYFDQGQDMSFSVVMVFLNVMADQLKKLSSSYYFKVENIEAMLGKKPLKIRSIMVKALMDISKEFACRSIKSCRSSQALAVQDESEVMVARVQGMIQWADSNHLMIVFHGHDSQTVSALYRNTADVPEDVVDLFKSQLKKDLENFDKMDQSKLQTKLERVARTESTEFDQEKLGEMKNDYALTPDNLLKMVLINLRIKAGVPIILMGETGCGKTSLVRYLAGTCEINFVIFNFHAGVTEERIQDKTLEMNHAAKKSPKRQFWLFLDEINTCDHLGLLNEIICHHSCKGIHLAKNLKFIAACNPYRLREETQVCTAGLQGKMSADPLSKLVYRVHPLPEAMIDYVWDYGILSEKDENSYIDRMMAGVFPEKAYHPNIVNALIASQKFLRQIETTAWSVSLRDVQRCKVLMIWFFDMLQEKSNFPLKVREYTKPFGEHEFTKRAIILALCHSYYSRLPSSKQRKEYLNIVARQLNPRSPIGQAEDFAKIIRMEQMDLLNRMQLPAGIAKNTALRENVFVILVCILNKIPVFVVGKPGCSKSLSMQLLKSNLRGQDSNDSYFKTLPQLYMVSYQGSESSTSEGIEKVFQKAEQYLKHNKDEHVLPVVLLDEVGLAEVSRFNPLKVLHNLLEPATGKVPNVAVVGISNWALDAAKMNRAIHLSRPDLDVEELVDTAISIGSEYQGKLLPAEKIQHKRFFTALANAYFVYHKEQIKTNFHGLRDYYALIKYVSKHIGLASEEKDKIKIIWKGLQRNFGGRRTELNHIIEIFQKEVKEEFNKTTTMESIEIDNYSLTSTELIRGNLMDVSARYLMLITSGDSAVGILEKNLKEQNQEYEVIMGSQFDEDQTENYSYRILSRIILCMERGVVLILKDLDHIYGSLYDLLNQNYTQSGNKRHCRIAIGPYSNPMCQVHDNFRCVVLMDEKSVNLADPPFLNRFEKQFLQIKDVVNPWQKKLVEGLNEWSLDFCTVEHFHFNPDTCFLGFHKDLIPSLVLECCPSNNDDLDEGAILQACKEKLQRIATPDAILRLTCSSLRAKHREDVDCITRQGYFQKEVHRSLHDCINFCHRDGDEDENGTLGRGMRLVVYTHSNVHTDVKKEVDFPVEIKKLSAYKSEGQLTKDIKRFWFESKCQYLFLQCKPSLDADHILLAKYQIESCASKYISERGEDKHVVFIIHIDRHVKEIKATWQFNFLSGWNLVTVDMLESSPYPFTAVLDKSLVEILDSKICPLEKVVKQCLLWAFTCIKYAEVGRSNNVKEILQNIEDIKRSDHAVTGLATAVRQQMEQMSPMNQKGDLNPDSWQVKVACDANALGNASTFWTALLQHAEEAVKAPLAKLVFILESQGAWHCCLTTKDPETESIWLAWLLDSRIVDTDKVFNPEGAECYELNSSVHSTLSFPFVKHFETRLANVKQIFLEDLVDIKKNQDNLDETEMIKPEQLLSQITKYREMFKENVQLLLDNPYTEKHLDMYFEDLFLLTTSTNTLIPKAMKVDLIAWILEERMSLSSTDGCLDKFIAYHFAVWYFEPLLQHVVQMVSVCIEAMPAAVDLVRDYIKDNLTKIIKEHAEKENAKEDLDTESAVAMSEINTDVEALESLAVTAADCGSKSHPESSDDENSEVDGDASIPDKGASTDDINVTLMTQDKESDEEETQNDLDIYGAASAMPTEVLEPNVAFVKEQKVSNIQEKRDLNSEEDNPTIDHEDKQKIEDEDQEGETETEPEEAMQAEELLVDFLCKLMYPSHELLTQFKDVQDWQSKVSTLQSFASTVSCFPTSLHFLSLCNDFSTCIIMPYNVDITKLSSLGELGNECGDDVMTNAELLQFVHSITTELVQIEQVPKIVAQKFLCTCISRCLDLDPENQLLPDIITWAVKGTMPDPELGYLGPVLHKLLSGIGDDITLFQTLCHIIIHEKQEAYYQPFEYIDQQLQTTDENGFTFSTLLTDVLEKEGFEEMPFSYIEDIGCGKTELEILQIASDLVRSREVTSFRVIVAVAYSKKLLQRIPILIGKKHKDLPLILQQVDIALSSREEDPTEDSTAFRDYFLKYMKAKHSLAKVKVEISNISKSMKSLNTIEWPRNETVLGLGFQPLIYHPHIKVVEEAIEQLLEEREEDLLKDFILTAKSNPDHMMAFFSFLFSQFVLTQTVSQLKDTEKELRDTIWSHCTSLCPSHKIFAEKLLLKEDFGFEMMHFTEDTPLRNVQMASILYHMMSLIVATNQKGREDTMPKKAAILAKCAMSPEKVTEAFLPSCSNSNILKTYAITTSDTQSMNFHQCQTGNVVGQRIESGTCELCHGPFQENQVAANIRQLETKTKEEDLPGYQQELPAEELWCVCARGMSPVHYRVLRILLHGSFLAAHALENLNSKEQAPDDPLSINNLESQFKTDWKALSEILDATDEGVCRYMHFVIEHMAQLIAIEPFPCSTAHERLEYEEEFVAQLEDLDQDGNTKRQEWFTNICKQTGFRAEHIECKMNEIEIDRDPNLLTSIFHRTGSLSLVGLKRNFMRSKQEKETQFLGYFLANGQKIELLKYLQPLIKWRREVHESLQRRLSQEECYDYTIANFFQRLEGENRE